MLAWIRHLEVSVQDRNYIMTVSNHANDEVVLALPIQSIRCAKLTLLAMHSCKARAESLQAPMLLISLEEAQQANMVANSAAQGAAAASFFGLTLSLFNFILMRLIVGRDGRQSEQARSDEKKVCITRVELQSNFADTIVSAGKSR